MQPACVESVAKGVRLPRVPLKPIAAEAARRFAMFQWIRRFLCSHVCSLKEMHREKDGMVAATCLKCGKVLRADFGLVLPCTWEE